MTGNDSLNLNQTINSTSKNYVFAPVSFSIRLSLFISMLSFGAFGFVANFLILNLKQKQNREKKRQLTRSFKRPLTEYFIISLALSDLLCSSVSFPLSASEMFFDVFQNDWICKLFRFFNIFFPVVTIYSLLVIGIERYLSIFRPFSVISREKARRMVIGAWVLAFLVTLVPMVTYKRVHYAIDGNSFTLICKYDNSLPLYRILFTIFLLIIYIIPSFILTFINIRIMKYYKNHVPAGSSMVDQKAKHKITRMFVSLIFAFIAPYLCFIAYSAFMMIIQPKTSLAIDFVARHTSAFLGYSNGAISAIILFYNDNYLRGKVVRMLRCLDCRQPKISAEVQIKSKNSQENQGCADHREDSSSKENAGKISREEETPL